jgi:hypothetical protein
MRAPRPWSSRTALLVLFLGLVGVSMPLACVETNPDAGDGGGAPPDTGGTVGGLRLELSGDL